MMQTFPESAAVGTLRAPLSSITASWLRWSTLWLRARSVRKLSPPQAKAAFQNRNLIQITVGHPPEQWCKVVGRHSSARVKMYPGFGRGWC